MRHQGPKSEYRMDNARRRRRAELPQYVSRVPRAGRKDETMRWAILSASVAALGLAAGSSMPVAFAASAPVAASPATPVERDPAALLRATSPSNPAANRTY